LKRTMLGHVHANVVVSHKVLAKYTVNAEGLPGQPGLLLGRGVRYFSRNARQHCFYPHLLQALYDETLLAGSIFLALAEQSKCQRFFVDFV